MKTRTYGIVEKNISDLDYEHDYERVLTTTDMEEVKAFFADKIIARYTVEEFYTDENGDFVEGSDFDEPENWLKRHSEDETVIVVRDREAGNIIERVNSKEEGERLIAEYEAQDKQENKYSEDFYEIAKISQKDYQKRSAR